jgi:hypothetical protein
MSIKRSFIRSSMREGGIKAKDLKYAYGSKTKAKDRPSLKIISTPQPKKKRGV